MGVPLGGIDPKRCTPFILTTPSESPNNKFAFVRNGFEEFDLGKRGYTRRPDLAVTGSVLGPECRFCLGALD